MLRRTNLKRNTPLQRKPMKRKRRKGDKPEVRYEYASQFQACCVCWSRAGQFGVVLHCHHLVSGSGRVDVRANLATVCGRCHRHYHDGGEVSETGIRLSALNPCHLMFCKKESDPEFYDAVVIRRLLGRLELPERWRPKKPPQWVYRERERNMR